MKPGKWVFFDACRDLAGRLVLVCAVLVGSVALAARPQEPSHAMLIRGHRRAASARSGPALGARFGAGWSGWRCGLVPGRVSGGPCKLARLLDAVPALFLWRWANLAEHGTSSRRNREHRHHSGALGTSGASAFAWFGNATGCQRTAPARGSRPWGQWHPLAWTHGRFPSGFAAAFRPPPVSCSHACASDGCGG